MIDRRATIVAILISTLLAPLTAAGYTINDMPKIVIEFGRHFDPSTAEVNTKTKYLMLAQQQNQTNPSQAPLANVDPGTIGEWETAVNAGRWILRIEPNGAYAFHSEAGDSAPPDSGVFSSQSGRWALRANSGYVDGGAYSIVSPNAFVAKGRLGTATWRRVAGAPKSILGQIDGQTVGE